MPIFVHLVLSPLPSEQMVHGYAPNAPLDFAKPPCACLESGTCVPQKLTTAPILLFPENKELSTSNGFRHASSVSSFTLRPVVMYVATDGPRVKTTFNASFMLVNDTIARSELSSITHRSTFRGPNFFFKSFGDRFSTSAAFRTANPHGDSADASEPIITRNGLGPFSACDNISCRLSSPTYRMYGNTPKAEWKNFSPP